MPQLVKCGKNAFAWTKVTDTGRIIIPDDAYLEYDFQEDEIAILMSGSKTSGGFALTRLEKFLDSPISSEVSRTHPGLINQEIPKGESVRFRSKFLCWTEIDGRSITLPSGTLKNYGIIYGNLLLTVRGSDLGLAFIVKGPIIEEAKKHDELNRYEYDMINRLDSYAQKTIDIRLLDQYRRENEFDYYNSWCTNKRPRQN